MTREASVSAGRRARALMWDSHLHLRNDSRRCPTSALTKRLVLVIFIRDEEERVAATLPQHAASRGGSTNSNSHGHVRRRSMQDSHANDNLGISNEAACARARHDLCSAHRARNSPTGALSHLSRVST